MKKIEIAEPPVKQTVPKSNQHKCKL